MKRRRFESPPPEIPSGASVHRAFVTQPEAEAIRAAIDGNEVGAAMARGGLGY